MQLATQIQMDAPTLREMGAVSGASAPGVPGGSVNYVPSATQPMALEGGKPTGHITLELAPEAKRLLAGAGKGPSMKPGVPSPQQNNRRPRFDMGLKSLPGFSPRAGFNPRMVRSPNSYMALKSPAMTQAGPKPQTPAPKMAQRPAPRAALRAMPMAKPAAKPAIPATKTVAVTGLAIQPNSPALGAASLAARMRRVGVSLPTPNFG